MPAKDEVKEYIERAQQGRAGQDPRDVAAAKAGDPYAQARIRYRESTNRINDDLAQKKITAETAAILIQSANASYQQALAMIEAQAAQEQQSRDLRDIEMQLQRRNQQLREQQYRNQEQQKSRQNQREANRYR